MSYSIKIKRSAQKCLAMITQSDRDKIIKKIQNLSDNPRPENCKKLAGREAWRIRIWSYRVIYEISDNQLVVLVVMIGHRREVYK
ncbi:MAG: type II toxin-antitoxin system RelE/ParE family toxin [Candidatus Competibacteraceae bacterium]|jgi:mRNA interferase RelE/StbE|nr:type II toxin-antitoxin system RelE/ParE family toxin [Candidatus Competibacteraceae bacterium]